MIVKKIILTTALIAIMGIELYRETLWQS